MLLKNLGIAAALLLPIYLASSTKAFSGGLPCVDEYDWKTYHYAEVLHREARGEGRDGMVAVLSGLRNGARGYKTGKLDPEIVELVVEGMKENVGHRFRHWIRPEHATDTAQLRKATGAIRKGEFLKVGNHWFY